MKRDEGRQLSKICWYAIGGEARYYAQPQSVEEMQDHLVWARGEGLPVFMLGHGSNVLFDDEGFDGLVVCTRSLSGFREREKGIVEVEVGKHLGNLVDKVNDLGLQGLETFVGIPGTIGGAVYGNAGASSGGIGDADLVSEVLLIEPSGTMEWVDGRDLSWRYRDSGIGDRVVARVRIRLQPDFDSEKLCKKSQRFLKLKTDTQPFTNKTCGCIFKNPARMSAGRLIDECGLKGVRFGGAMISPVHANFIENVDGATSSDIKHLIDRARKLVRDQHGLELQREVVLPGTRGE
ncbi:MAG: UDP-N-acetylmuramate dehydrogenase [Planctomycetes bacterium]|nr:UDP-N-acetylmuramate dehydrogenase [Planctomycetota bacterium]